MKSRIQNSEFKNQEAKHAFDLPSEHPNPQMPAADSIQNRRAIFLDRDGVLNVEAGYLREPDALVMLPGAAEAVARFNRSGWQTIVFTNQSGVGRGFMTLDELERVHARLSEEIEKAGGTLAGVYACPHHPDDGCDCRKPLPGLLLQAAREHDIDLTQCCAVGDTPRDLHAAHAVGCRTFLVLSGHTRAYSLDTFPDPQPDAVLPDLAAVAALLTD